MYQVYYVYYIHNFLHTPLYQNKCRSNHIFGWNQTTSYLFLYKKKEDSSVTKSWAWTLKFLGKSSTCIYIYFVISKKQCLSCDVDMKLYFSMGKIRLVAQQRWYREQLKHFETVFRFTSIFQNALQHAFWALEMVLWFKLSFSRKQLIRHLFKNPIIILGFWLQSYSFFGQHYIT